MPNFHHLSSKWFTFLSWLFHSLFYLQHRNIIQTHPNYWDLLHLPKPLSLQETEGPSLLPWVPQNLSRIRTTLKGRKSSALTYIHTFCPYTPLHKILLTPKIPLTENWDASPPWRTELRNVNRYWLCQLCLNDIWCCSVSAQRLGFHHCRKPRHKNSVFLGIAFLPRDTSPSWATTVKELGTCILPQRTTTFQPSPQPLVS